MKMDSLRQILAEARRLELLTGSFELSLQNRTNPLHRSIELPSQGQYRMLVEFVSAYIEQVASLIETMGEQARNLGLRDAAWPALRTALVCCSRLSDLPIHGGEHPPKLRQLMEQAYLAQRLLEEIDDLFALWHGIRLMPYDTTHASLIIHQLIDEPHANQLDVLASLLAEEQLSLIQKHSSGESSPHEAKFSESLRPAQLRSSVRLNIGNPYGRQP